MVTSWWLALSSNPGAQGEEEVHPAAGGEPDPEGPAFGGAATAAGIARVTPPSARENQAFAQIRDGVRRAEERHAEDHDERHQPADREAVPPHRADPLRRIDPTGAAPRAMRECDRRSGPEQPVVNLALVDGRAFGPALVAVDQPGVVDAQDVEDRGVEVVDVEPVLDGVQADLVGLADDDARP